MNGTILPPQAEHIAAAVVYYFHKIPGSGVVIRYVQSSHQNDPARTVIELLLFVFVLRYLVSSSYSPKADSKIALTEEEIDELVEEWSPEPLVSEPTEAEKVEIEKSHFMSGPIGPKSEVHSSTSNDKRIVVNLATYNHYGFSANPDLKTKAIEAIRTYGVGPCSAPGFYGTFDVHGRTEADIAAHIGMPACIVYSQSFITASSVIPSFCKRGDIIVADKGINYALRQGIQLSRSIVRWYEHNDMDDLEAVLERIIADSRGKPLTRRFIITEGLFENSGDIIDLPRLVEIKSKYKFRLLLDETWSYGVLGGSGRGVTEQQNVDPNQVDLLIGSLAGAIAAGGGFCAGSVEAVEHQRLSSAGFTYSASLPVFLATTASESAKVLQTQPSIIESLRQNINALRMHVSASKNEWMECTSAPESPIMFLSLKEQHVLSRGLTENEQRALLQDVMDECFASGVLITRTRTMPLLAGAKDQWQPRPALKICVTNALTKKEMERAGKTISYAIAAVMKRKKWQKGH